MKPSNCICICWLYWWTINQATIIYDVNLWCEIELYILRQVGLHSLSPQPSDTSFESWWEKAIGATSGLMQKGLNSLIVLGAWTLWNHRNRCVFYGIVPSLGAALTLAGEERRLWSLAGAKGLSSLTAPLLGGCLMLVFLVAPLFYFRARV
jgi:hypothetical protein